MKIIKEGRRLYLSGNTYPIKDKIKSAGGHWDADRKMWWVGSQALAEFEALAESAPKEEYVPVPITDDTRVLGRVKYKNRPYYVVAEGRERYRLVTLDAKLDFWAVKDQCEWIKRYESRTQFAGYGRGQVEIHQTMGGLRKFIKDRKAEKASGVAVCGECGKGGDLVSDLEDGMMKHRHCCDIPPN